MNLRKITFGALFLGLLGTQSATACEETSGNLREYSTTYILEGNKTLCSLADQRVPSITSITPLAKTKTWNLHPKIVCALWGAADGIILIPHSVGVVSSFFIWPWQTIVGLSILCAADNLYDYNANSEENLRLEKEYYDSRIGQPGTKAYDENSGDLENFSTSYILEGNKTLCTQMDQRVSNITEITPLAKTALNPQNCTVE